MVAFKIRNGDIDTAERMALAWMDRAERMQAGKEIRMEGHVETLEPPAK